MSILLVTAKNPLKTSISINNMGNDGLFQVLRNEDMSQLRKLTIHQDGLESIKFLDSIRLPSLRDLKITGGDKKASIKSPKYEIVGEIKSHIHSTFRLERLELETKRVFEGIYSLVEGTNDLLIIPLPLFSMMCDIYSVHLKVTSIKFKFVTLDALELIRTKTEYYTRTNTSVEIVKFAASTLMGHHTSYITSCFIDEIILLARVMFKRIRCIDLEEKNFIEPENLKKVVVSLKSHNGLPDLSIICINNLVLHMGITDIIKTAKQLGRNKVYKLLMLYDLIDTYAIPNTECIEFAPFKKIEDYMDRKPLIPEPIFATVNSMHNENKKNTIAIALGYNKSDFNRYYE